MCRASFLLGAYVILHLVNGYGVHSRGIQKRQVQLQSQEQTNIDPGSILNLATNLHKLAGNILNRVQQSVQNGDRIQFGAQFQSSQDSQFGPPEPHGRPPFGPPPGHNMYGPPHQQFFGDNGPPPGPPPPPHHHHHHHHGHHGPPGFGPPGYGPPDGPPPGGPPPGGPPPGGPPPGFRPWHPPPYSYDGKPDAQSPTGLNNQNGGQPNNDFGQIQDDAKKLISGYIDGIFPVILLDPENEIR